MKNCNCVNCPEPSLDDDILCTGAPINAHCVKSTQELDCIGSEVNDRLDTILANINAKLCQLVTNDDEHTRDVICQMVQDTPTINLTCDDGNDSLQADLIVGVGDNTLDRIMFWSGTEVLTRTIEDLIPVFSTDFSLVFQDSDTIDFTATPSTVTADVRISTTPENAIQAFPDGIWAPLLAQNQLVYGGVVTWTGVGYIYDITAAGYYINGVFYESPDTQVTLAGADSTYNRVDSFIVDTLGQASVLTGIPSDNPSEPGSDLGTQLRLGSALVVANTIQPLQDQCIYQEASEWTIATTGTTFNPTSAVSPCFGSVSIEGTNAITGDTILFTEPTNTPFAPKSYGTLRIILKSKGAWGGGLLAIQWQNFFSNVGNYAVVSNAHYGFNELDTTDCQTINIPINDFGLTGASMADSLQITAIRTSSAFGFYIDNICLLTEQIGTSSINLYKFQNGLTQLPNTNTVEFGGGLLHTTTLETNSFIQNFSGATVYDYPFQFSQRQSFQSGTSIVSFKNAGNNLNTEPDYLNTVKLGINYTGKTYLNSPAYGGYLGNQSIAYMESVNIKGHGSFGLDVENANSKIAGIAWHTLDTANTDAITFFAKHPPTPSQSIGIGGNTGLRPYRAAVIHTDLSTEFLGKTYLNAARFEQAYGANVTAGNSITLPNDGNAFTVAGNTQINAITTANWQAGSIVRLSFNGTPTVKHNTPGGGGTAKILLAGSADYTVSANDVLTLLYDGTFWHETSRKQSSSSGAFVTADNGLSMSTATNVQLGGPVGTPSPLLHDSYIDNSTFVLDITGARTGVFAPTLNISNTGIGSGIAIKATSTGLAAIYGTCSGSFGIVGESTGGGIGVEGLSGGGSPAVFGSNSGVGDGVQGQSINGVGGHFISFPAVGSGIVSVVTVQRNSSVTPVDGIGGSLDFAVANTTSNASISNQIISKWTTVNTGTRTSLLELWGVNNTTSLKKADLDSTSGFTVYSPQSTTIASAELNTTPDAWSVTGGVTFNSAGRYNVSGSGTLFFNFGTLTIGDQYVLRYTLNNVIANNTNSFGGVTDGENGGGPSGSRKYYFRVTSTSGTLTINLTSQGAGAYIEAISLKRLVTPIPLAYAHNSESGLNGWELRSDSTLNSVYSGYQAGYYSYIGGYNTSHGRESLHFNASGDYNTAIGYRALYSDGRPMFSTAIGYNALVSSKSSQHNTAVGYNSLTTATSGYFNTAIGSQTLSNLTTGIINTVVGYSTGLSITTGTYNTLIGGSTATTITTGQNNVVVGGASGGTMTSASDQVLIGTSSGNSITTGIGNIGIGYAAASVIATGNYNIGIGELNGSISFAALLGGWTQDQVAQYSTTGGDNRNVLIGGHTWLDKTTNTDITDAIAIGYAARAYQNHQAVFGGTTITSTFLRGDTELRNYQTVAAESLQDNTFPAATTKWSVTGAVTLATNKVVFNTNTSLSGTLKQVQADMSIAGKSARYYRLLVTVDYTGSPGPTYQPLTITVSGSTFASTDLIMVRENSGLGGTVTYQAYFKSKSSPTDITFTFTASSIAADGIVNVTNISLKEVIGGDMFINRNLEVYGGALKLTTQFTPANSTDATYAIGTLTADDSFLWYRKSNGDWVKTAWAAF